MSDSPLPTWSRMSAASRVMMLPFHASEFVHFFQHSVYSTFRLDKF